MWAGRAADCAATWLIEKSSWEERAEDEEFRGGEIHWEAVATNVPSGWAADEPRPARQCDFDKPCAGHLHASHEVDADLPE